MELYQLQIFVIVAEEKSVTRAAKRLFTTPSSVSAHIKNLEDELNVQLFARKSHGMDITEKGQLLYEKAQHTLSSAQDLLNYATEIQSYLIGDVRLGLNAQSSFLRIPQLIAALRDNCPGIDLKLLSLSSGKVIDALLAEDLDIGFVFGEMDDSRFHMIHLQKAQLSVVAPMHMAETINKADWPQIAELPWICSDGYCPFQVEINHMFQSMGLSSNNIVQSNDETTKAELVVSGVGLSLLESTEAQSLAERGKLIIWETEPIYSDLSVICLAHRHKDPLIKPILSHVAGIWS